VVSEVRPDIPMGNMADANQSVKADTEYCLFFTLPTGLFPLEVSFYPISFVDSNTFFLATGGLATRDAGVQASKTAEFSERNIEPRRNRLTWGCGQGMAVVENTQR
jgi:hypothetical protein